MSGLGRRGRLLRVLGGLGVCAAGLGYPLWSEHQRRTELDRLAQEDRIRVFEATLTGFRTLCVEQQPTALGSYCASQKELLESFPECGAPCRKLLARNGSGATR